MGTRTAIALAAALLITGGAFASPSLYVPGAALAILAVGTAGWTLLAAHGARIERVAGPASVVEGEPYPLRLRLRGGPLPPRGELVEPLLERPVPVRVLGGRGLRMGVARGRASVRETVRFERWGRRQLEPARLVLRDPLGICERAVSEPAPGQVLVLPRIEPVETSPARGGDRGGAALAGLGEGASAGRAAPLGVDLDGLRPYRKGSPASRIHWPAVARHRELIERRLSSGGEGVTLVVLDAERPADETALERAVRATASLCFHLAKAGGCALLISGSSQVLQIDRQLRGWAQAHARLALVEPGRPLRGATHAATGGPVLWVTPADDGARAGGRIRASALVTPLPPEGSRPAFTVAGCAVVPLTAPGGAARPATGRAA